MTTTTQHITTDDVGKVYVQRTMTGPLAVGLDGARIVKPQERVDRYVISAVKPADPSYYRTCPDAGPRVEVQCHRILKLRGGGRKVATGDGCRMWLPTTGNDRMVEVEP